MASPQLSDYYPPGSVEAESWAHVEKYTHTHLVTTANIAYAARYDALRLFLTGDGVYIPPRSVLEVKELLERHVLSYLYTHMSYLRPSPQGSDFSSMKRIALEGLASLVRQHQRAFLSLYEHCPEWDGQPSPPRRVREVERA